MLIKDLINEKMNELSRSEKIIANKIIDGSISPLHHSITQAAQIAGVSISLVNKFCNKIGASGWKTFRSLCFLELRSKNQKASKLLSDEYNLLENTLVDKEKEISKFISSLYSNMNKSEKVIIFANGTTKMIVDTIAYKLNKLDGNIVTYDYTESFIHVNFNNTILFVSISGLNDKISYYQRSYTNKNQFLITFGEDKKFEGTKLSLGIYKNFSKLEKSFPVITDVFMHFILNKLVSKRLEEITLIKKKIINTKLDEL